MEIDEKVVVSKNNDTKAVEKKLTRENDTVEFTVSENHNKDDKNKYKEVKTDIYKGGVSE